MKTWYIKVHSLYVKVAQRVERWTCNQQVVGSNLIQGKSCVKILASCLHLRASVTKQYNLVLAKGRWCFAAGMVTAGLAESNGSLSPGGWIIVTCGLTACTPGSALGPTLCNEYGKPFSLYVIRLQQAASVAWNVVMEWIMHIMPSFYYAFHTHSAGTHCSEIADVVMMMLMLCELNCGWS